MNYIVITQCVSVCFCWAEEERKEERQKKRKRHVHLYISILLWFVVLDMWVVLRSVCNYRYRRGTQKWGRKALNDVKYFGTEASGYGISSLGPGSKKCHSDSKSMCQIIRGGMCSLLHAVITMWRSWHWCFQALIPVNERVPLLRKSCYPKTRIWRSY